MLPNADCQITIENLKGKLSAAYEYLINNNDDKNAQKTAQLAEKLFSHDILSCFLRILILSSIVLHFLYSNALHRNYF